MNAISSLFGGGSSASVVPPAVQTYTPAPAAQNPQSVQAGQAAEKQAASAGGAQAMLAGMQSSGLTTPANTTKTQLGS